MFPLFFFSGKGAKHAENTLVCTKESIERNLMIRTKDARLVPFVLNAAQKRLLAEIERQEKAGKPVRIIILKARQMGFSTLVQALLFLKTAGNENYESLIVAHKDEATGNLFRMSRRFYENLPPGLAPKLVSNKGREMIFDTSGQNAKELGSRIRCATAGGSGVGRSYTLQSAHLSEFAFWPGDKTDTYSGIAQAVPDKPGTMLIIESTANGYNEFKTLWDAAVKAQRDGTDGFVPIFFPWFEMEEYRRPPPPGFAPTKEEQALKARFSLDDAQLAWRRWCIAANCGGEERRFRQEYPATPDEAFLSTGDCVFDAQAVEARRAQAEAFPVKRGRFVYDFDDRAPRGEKIRNIRFVEGDRPIVRILKEPEEGVPYVLGGDTAGTGSDRFTGQVLDNRSGAQAAVLQHERDETLYTRQMYCLGMYYNGALLGVETNYSTYPQKELERLGYPHFYVRERVDTFTGKTEQAYGFETTAVTRPLILDNLRAVCRADLTLVGDYETLGEMLTFVYGRDYKPQALGGKHDDLVMALAIAHHIRTQQRKRAGKPSMRAWTKDMREDYRRADAEGKKHLLEKYGKPSNGGA